jgi:anaphase-promoting complex subunit 5
MARYLTPSKVGLLALISVYIDGVVPTAATVPVLSFLITQLIPIDKPSSKVAEGSTLSIEDFQNKLINLTSGVPGRTIWDWLLKKLWELDSLDALHAFFDFLPDFLAKTREELLQDKENGIAQDNEQIRLSRTSPLGTFVRRAQVEFLRLQFDDAIILWKSFVEFREPTRSLWKRRNPAIAKTGFDSNLTPEGDVYNLLYGDILDNSFKSADVSSDDLEILLEFQIDKIQSEW